MRTRIIYCIASFLACSAFNLMAAQKDAPEKGSILAADEHYVEAFNAGDADAAAGDFTADAVYVTDDGRTLKGRDEIRNELADQFDDAEGDTLKLNVYAIDIAADKQHATERGVSIVTHDDGTQEPDSYIAEFTREGDRWLVSRVVEKPQAASAEHLDDLAWMIGDWTDQSENEMIRTKAEWSLDRGFITRKFAVSGGGRRDLTGIEYIGWDPEKKEIRSWYFDSAGGFGTGRWRHESNSWIEDASGTTPTGESAGATFVFTPKDQDSFGWRSVRRQVGGEAQPDLPEVVIRRTSDEDLEEARGNL